VTVLTGFLGSGKTTLLNNILADQTHGLRFAIIENEFGEVGVDEKLIAATKDGSNKQFVDEEVIEVMNGCICCTVRGDLVEALKRLYKKIASFDAVLIETTGMADPAPVAQTFFVDDAIKEMYSLDGIITVVDAAHVEAHLDEEKPEGAENESQEQIAFADRIILNKCDLLKGTPAKAADSDSTKMEDVECKEDGKINLAANKTTGLAETAEAGEEALTKLEARIKGINPNASIIRTEYSKVDPKSLLNISAFDLDRVLEMDPGFLDADGGDHVHDDSISSVAWKFPGTELNVNKLNMWISDIMRDLGTELFRYKGVLAVKGCKEKFIFQGVHMMFTGGFAGDVLGPESLKTSAGLWQSDEERECRFVFIGKNIKQKHHDKLKEGFLACEAEKELRFKVGDLVEARVRGGFTPAKVIRVWDEGNPYRLELQTAAKTNVWGPVDDSAYVKPASGGYGN